MTECQVFSLQSGPSLQAATKGQEHGKRGVLTFHCALPPPPHKFNAFNENGLLGRDIIEIIERILEKHPPRVRLVIGAGLTIFYFSLATFFGVHARTAHTFRRIREQQKMAAKTQELQPRQRRGVAWERKLDSLL